MELTVFEAVQVLKSRSYRVGDLFLRLESCVGHDESQLQELSKELGAAILAYDNTLKYLTQKTMIVE